MDNQEKTMNVEDAKTNATKVAFEFKYSPFRELVSALEQVADKGENGYIEFYDQKFYSSEMPTIEEVCKQITGLTYDEFQDYAAEMYQGDSRPIDWQSKVLAGYMDKSQEQSKDGAKTEKENSTRVSFEYKSNPFRELVDKLNECNDKGENVHIEFYDQKFYSSEIPTIEEVCKQITGLTYDEFQDYAAEMYQGDSRPIDWQSKVLAGYMNENKEQVRNEMEKAENTREPLDLFADTIKLTEEKVTFSKIKDSISNLLNKFKEFVKKGHEKSQEYNILER